ncbi:MAG: hypothetical protein DRP71_14985 [Verrucomicrobia bacterium]|nr:MAG: hypothetical protein DRP71_14985 [Verrucomicrobiota bacterium]
MHPPDTYELCVIGGGSGGFAAALAAARRGRSVVLVEKADCLGGNAVRCGVNTWEMGIGGTDIPRFLYERMKAVPEAVGIYSIDRHCCWPHRNDPPFPGGESIIDPTRTYEDSLQRYGTNGLIEDAERARELWHGVTFEPQVCAGAQQRMLEETGHCQVLLNHAFIEGHSNSNGVLDSISIESEANRREIQARYFVDATADAVVCEWLECAMMQGRDAASTFGEENAPAEANPEGVNAATLVYRISQRAGQALPALDVPFECWFRDTWPVASFTQVPNGDRIVNMLPTMEGDAVLSYVRKGASGYREGHAECTRRVHGHWQHVQREFPEFRAFRLQWIAPALGIRESKRVMGEYVLREKDVIDGLPIQKHPDIIAIADHAPDIHGRHSKGCAELAHPYGIPFRCLVPRGWRNLLVACRGASFSHIAASSCRLSRTMMALGHAAGLAVDQAIDEPTTWTALDFARLRAGLIAEGAPLEWPERA